jgi:hypothetical protein
MAMDFQDSPWKRNPGELSQATLARLGAIKNSSNHAHPNAHPARNGHQSGLVKQ